MIHFSFIVRSDIFGWICFSIPFTQLFTFITPNSTTISTYQLNGLWMVRITYPLNKSKKVLFVIFFNASSRADNYQLCVHNYGNYFADFIKFFCTSVKIETINVVMLQRRQENVFFSLAKYIENFFKFRYRFSVSKK